jgi:hypothetical protein
MGFVDGNELLNKLTIRLAAPIGKFKLNGEIMVFLGDRSYEPRALPLVGNANRKLLVHTLFLPLLST